MVDLLTEQYDVVIRYQGGGNAGHTVVNEYGKFALPLLPSGIFRKGVLNILGNGVALDLENLWTEIEQVRSQGVAITPENLRISERASLLLPWHRELDGLEEARLKDRAYGSTKQGIAPFYSDRSQKKTLLAGELFELETLREHAAQLAEWKNLTLTGVYGAEPVAAESLMAWLQEYGEKLKPFICNTTKLLKEKEAEGKRFLFEAQLGSLRDLDYGIVPYTTSSNPIAAYAPVGSGMPWAKIDEVIGVVKAYSTCVGEGPFVCEMFGEEAEKLREAGISSALVNLGGNVQALGGKPGGKPFRVAIENPEEDGAYLGILAVTDLAVITSGDYERFFEKDGRIYHHILDPATGRPAESGLHSVTVVCSDGVMADALSTAIFVMGEEKAASFWRENSPAFQMVLLAEDGTLFVTEGLKDIFETDREITWISTDT